MKDKPVDRDIDRMRELLARTPPADPALPERADAVVARARRSRRRRGVIGGVAVALFAAAVIVTPHFLSTSPTTNEATDPSNGANVSQTPDPWTADPCPVKPIDISKASSVPELVEGAESVRVCPAVWPHVQGSESKQDLLSSWEAPADAVVDAPDDFVKAVNAADAWDPAQCAALDWKSDPFAIVLTYAGGTSVMGAQAPICNPVKVGGREIGSDALVAAFVDAIKSQNASLKASEPVEPACASVDQQKLSTFEVDQLAGPTVAGVVCYTVDPNGGPQYASDMGALTTDQIAALEADFKANADTTTGMCIDTGPTRVVRLVDEWGNVTAWVDDHCTGDFYSPAGSWSPSPRAEQIIADVLGGPAGE